MFIRLELRRTFAREVTSLYEFVHFDYFSCSRMNSIAVWLPTVSGELARCLQLCFGLFICLGNAKQSGDIKYLIVVANPGFNLDFRDLHFLSPHLVLVAELPLDSLAQTATPHAVGRTTFSSALVAWPVTCHT